MSRILGDQTSLRDLVDQLHRQNLSWIGDKRQLQYLLVGVTFEVRLEHDHLRDRRPQHSTFRIYADLLRGFHSSRKVRNFLVLPFQCSDVSECGGQLVIDRSCLFEELLAEAVPFLEVAQREFHVGPYPKQSQSEIVLSYPRIAAYLGDLFGRDAAVLDRQRQRTKGGGVFRTLDVHLGLVEMVLGRDAVEVVHGDEQIARCLLFWH
mmetsp:Transcript_12291/g.35657  ORF Transcript_12291/g.35657 Transcript_12291/m.35657 type:complete len:207 (+) Transcript_12291:108-728(+)